MKLGIRKIRYVHVANVRDFSFLSRGSKFDFRAYLSADPTELPFTVETAILKEQHIYDDNGHYSNIDFSASIRAEKEVSRQQMQELTGRNHIFEVETVAGTRYVIGSKEFLPSFEFEDSLSGNSKNEFIIHISCKSLHGALFNDF